MDARDLLEQAIDEQQGRLAAGIPPEREAALLALLRLAGPAMAGAPESTSIAAPGQWWWGLGTALRLCLCSDSSDRSVDAAAWAGPFLARCRDVELARMLVRLAEAGELRLASSDTGFDAWRSGRRPLSTRQERADIASWARSRGAERDAGPGGHRPGESLVAGMACQLPYPAEVEIGGIAVAAYRRVLAALADHALDTADDAGVVDRPVLVSAVAAASGIDAAVTARVIGALTLDAANAAWHAALPGGPPAPLVAVRPDRVAWSRAALMAEPLFFLGRELRRRDPEAWHRAAHAREAVFRDDLYCLFPGQRFVTSPGPILLRGGDRRNRTDIDAAVFDRKTGTLALFELKSQDAFARTAAESQRQRENLLRAGHQSAAVLDWVGRNGRDDVLNRIDPAAARRFRVQQVLAFVLGRYAADPGESGRSGRVAWSSWGRVLRLMDGPVAANPLLALHGRLIRDEGLEGPAGDDTVAVDIDLGGSRLVVYPSWSVMQAEPAPPQ